MKWSYRVAIVALSLLLAMLAACGSPSGSLGGTTGQPTLTCTDRTAAHPIDTMSVVLTCAVVNAPSAATSYTLQYTIVDALGHPRSMGATCAGSLSGGAGTCTQTYSLPIPLDPSKATVSGTLQPGGQKLGPVKPKQVSPPAGTPSPPLG